jgi:hypothetical protein
VMRQLLTMKEVKEEKKREEEEGIVGTEKM